LSQLEWTAGLSTQVHSLSSMIVSFITYVKGSEDEVEMLGIRSQKEVRAMVDTTSPTQTFTENGTFRSLPLLAFTWIMCLAKRNGISRSR
jgi:hypothetical protein